MSATTKADGRTLPWRVVGRAVRPYALAVSLATSVSVWSVATDRAVGALLDGLPGAQKTAGVVVYPTTWRGSPSATDCSSTVIQIRVYRDGTTPLNAGAVKVNWLAR